MVISGVEEAPTVEWLLALVYDAEEFTAADMFMMLATELGVETDTGVLLTGGCCFFLKLSYKYIKNQITYFLNLSD